MARPPKLSDKQRDEIKRRLLAGEKAADLAREFKVSRGLICQVNKQAENVKAVANQIVAAEGAIRELPVSDQLLAVSLADDLRAISTHLAGGAKFSAATFHRLSGIAHGKVQEIDDAAPLDDQSRSALKDVAILTKLANDAATVPVNLLAANKDTVKRLNEEGEQEPEDLSPERQLEAARRMAFILHRAGKPQEPAHG